VLRLARTRAVLERGVAERSHAGAQLCALRSGEPVGELALGRLREGAQVTPDSVLHWFSSVKPLMAVAIGQLVERRLVGFEDPVVSHIPEFAPHGKSAITLRHLLTHSACIPNAHRNWSHESWDEILAKICAAAPEPGWVIGRDCAYHVASAWYVLGEIVRRRDGRSYDRYVREAIFAPLGRDDFWVGMSAGDYGANRARIAEPCDATSGELKPIAYWAWNGSAEAVGLCRPGGSGWGTARALASVYAALLRGGAPLLRPDTTACILTPSIVGVRDRTFDTVLDRGLGVVFDSKRYAPAGGWYGPRASPRAFGHGGYFSSVAFADPPHDLAVALNWNGVTEPAKHQARLDEALTALYEDLGL
jgi:CubicO group peptidase (beta-lactamase class C family)